MTRSPAYFAEGKSMGMTDAQARAHVAEIEAARRDLEQQMLNTLATLPPPPCPWPPEERRPASRRMSGQRYDDPASSYVFPPVFEGSADP